MDPIFDPSKPPPKRGHFITITDPSTGQKIVGQLNPKTNEYEITRKSPSTLVNLHPRYSKVCEKTFNVIVIAMDPTTKLIGGYIFKDNNFMKAPDCDCQSCGTMDSHKNLLDKYSRIYGTNDYYVSTKMEPLIYLGIEWLGCFYSGVMNIFVDASGTIGKYINTPEGLKLVEENVHVKLLPAQSKNRDIILDKHLTLFHQKICPHIGQNIFYCSRDRHVTVDQFVFNRLTNQLEMIQCNDCDYDSAIKMKWYDEELRCLDVIPSLQHGKLIAFYCSRENRLEWNIYSIATKLWEDGQGQVLDNRDISIEDLKIRYNYQQNGQERLINDLDQFDGKSRKLLFNESGPFGNFYWMLDADYQIKPFMFHKQKPYAGSIQNIREIQKMKLFRIRREAKLFINPLGRNANPSYTELAKEFITHKCERCRDNQPLECRPEMIRLGRTPEPFYGEMERMREELYQLSMTDSAYAKMINQQSYPVFYPPPTQLQPSSSAQGTQTGNNSDPLKDLEEKYRKLAKAAFQRPPNFYPNDFNLPPLTSFLPPQAPLGYPEGFSQPVYMGRPIPSSNNPFYSPATQLCERIALKLQQDAQSNYPNQPPIFEQNKKDVKLLPDEVRVMIDEQRKMAAELLKTRMLSPMQPSNRMKIDEKNMSKEALEFKNGCDDVLRYIRTEFLKKKQPPMDLSKDQSKIKRMMGLDVDEKDAKKKNEEEKVEEDDSEDDLTDEEINDEECSDEEKEDRNPSDYSDSDYEDAELKALLESLQNRVNQN